MHINILSVPIKTSYVVLDIIDTLSVALSFELIGLPEEGAFHLLPTIENKTGCLLTPLLSVIALACLPNHRFSVAVPLLNKFFAYSAILGEDKSPADTG